MKRLTLFLALGLLFSAANAALAQPNITLSIKADKEVVEIVEGKEVIKRVPADVIEPDDTIFYTLEYANTGDQAAENVVFDDPIPASTRYVTGSAEGEGSDITFSIDGGKTYKKPSLLTYQLTLPDGTRQQKVASPEEYTHIRWTVAVIPPGASGELHFQAIVE